MLLPAFLVKLSWAKILTAVEAIDQIAGIASKYLGKKPSKDRLDTVEEDIGTLARGMQSLAAKVTMLSWALVLTTAIAIASLVVALLR